MTITYILSFEFFLASIRLLIVDVVRYGADTDNNNIQKRNSNASPKPSLYFGSSWALVAISGFFMNQIQPVQLT